MPEGFVSPTLQSKVGCCPFSTSISFQSFWEFETDSRFTDSGRVVVRIVSRLLVIWFSLLRRFVFVSSCMAKHATNKASARPF